MKIQLTFAVAVVAATPFAERQPYSRYQTIVDRQMFGDPPPGFDPTKPPSEVSRSDARADEEQLSKEQEQIKSAIHFSAINVTPSGDTAVGFTDSSDAKSPRHYYLKVGESRDGWLVKEADPVKATMTIAKGEVEVALTIGGNSASDAGSTKKTGASEALRRPGLLTRSPSAGAERPSMSSLGSLRGRRMLREQARQEEAAEAEARKAEEAKRREEERQRAEEEKAQREQEREEQRAQLMQIQEELRKAREARAAREAEAEAGQEDGDAE